MPTPFPSHPNFVGYDACDGKLHSGLAHAGKPKLIEAVAPLSKADFPSDTPKDWLKSLEAVRVWCASYGYEFAVSPYEYQLAKIHCEACTIVLWSARRKPGKQRYIKPQFEGPIFIASLADGILESIRAMVV